MRRLALLTSLLALTLGVSDAGAQVISVPKGGLRKDPQVFASVGIGLFSLQSVLDGSTQTGWSFSQTIEYHGSLEYALGRGSSFGVTASYANVPLAYYVPPNVAGGGIATNGYVNAHANVYTMGAQYALGPGSEGFHQLIVLNAGVIAFENFRADNGGARLQPQRDIDPRLGIGYGFGYGFAKTGEIYLVQEYGVALHQSQGLSGSDRRQYQQQTTKIGFRVGIGAR